MKAFLQVKKAKQIFVELEIVVNFYTHMYGHREDEWHQMQPDGEPG